MRIVWKAVQEPTLNLGDLPRNVRRAIGTFRGMVRALMGLFTLGLSSHEVRMARSATLLPLIWTLGVLSMPVSPCSATGAPAQTSQGAQATPEVLTVTVRALDTNARTLDVTTGVGHSLRLKKVQVGPTCQIRSSGAPAQLGDLKASKIVRIQYRKTPAGMLAEQIEIIQVESTKDNR